MHSGHRHSIFCILPPHLLKNVAQNATSAPLRQKALDTIATDTSVRALRMTGALLPAAPGRAMLAHVPGKKRRTIYDTKGSQSLPGNVARMEGASPSTDVAVNEAYDSLGATYDFYWEVFERDSIDDQGMDLNATVHFGQAYDNAFWDGSRMVFGDGDGEIFNRFTVSIDVIGHELTHGVTQDEAGLVYLNQPGALNESMSDVFGSLIKQKALNQTADKADWLIGAGLFTNKIKGVALRSMKAPGTAYDDPTLGKDPQPAHMKDYVTTVEDNGGVHINSGIPNRAFFLTASKLGGYAWEKAGRIWYHTLKDARLKKTAGFRAFARLTLSNAGSLFGAGSAEQKAVADAWKEVGVGL